MVPGTKDLLTEGPIWSILGLSNGDTNVTRPNLSILIRRAFIAGCDIASVRATTDAERETYANVYVRSMESTQDAYGLGPARCPDPGTFIHAVAAARGGSKIEAIKMLREATGWGLKETRDVIFTVLGLPL